jgi:hypothetical protein
MVSLASDVRLRRSVQGWSGCAFQATDHHDQLNTPDTRQNDWGMAVTHEPSEIAMTLADLLRSTSDALEI